MDNRLRELRKQHNVSQKELADAIGANSAVVISNYERNKNDIPMDNARKIAEFFNCSLDYLLNRSSDVKEVVPISTKIPIYGSVSAGYPTFCDQFIEGYVQFDSDDSDLLFGLRINGNSMDLAGLPNNSVAIVRKQSAIEDDEIAVVRVEDDEALVKKFYKRGNIVTLRPCSSDPSFSDQKFDLKKTNLNIIGKVVGAIIHF